MFQIYIYIYIQWNERFKKKKKYIYIFHFILFFPPKRSVKVDSDEGEDEISFQP